MTIMPSTCQSSIFMNISLPGPLKSGFRQLKVLESYFSFLFLMEESILYAKIAISQQIFFSKIQF